MESGLFLKTFAISNIHVYHYIYQSRLPVFKDKYTGDVS